MSSVYSTRFVAGEAASGLLGDIYYVPEGYTAVIVSADFVTYGTGTAVLIDAAGVIMWTDTPSVDGAGEGYTSYRGRYVVNAGEFIAVSCTAETSGGVCGYLLSA